MMLSMLLALALRSIQDPAAVDAPAVKPIESMWYIPDRLLDRRAAAELPPILNRWMECGVFDGYSIPLGISAVGRPEEAIRAGNAIAKATGGGLIVGVFPIGAEGWEANHRAPSEGRAEPDRSATQAGLLAALAELEADAFAWVLENTAGAPRAEQAARSAIELVRFAKARKRKAALWLSAHYLVHEPWRAVVRRVLAETASDADFIVWMDLPFVSVKEALGRAPASAEEGRMTPKVAAAQEKLLDQILTVTPREKAVVQWAHGSQAYFIPTQDVPGTTAYISLCQRKGINRFCLLLNPRRLEQAPWKGFYSALPRVRADR